MNTSCYQRHRILAAVSGISAALCVALGGCSGQTSSSASQASTADGARTLAVAGLIAIGHSGLTGENSDPARPGQEVRANSWATGTNPAVNSIYQRIVALRPQAADPVANTAQAGATAARLADQARQALASVPRPALAIIQTIDNDIQCDGTDPAHVKQFGTQLETALRLIADASPSTQILLVTQPGRPGTELRQVAPLLAKNPEIRKNYAGPPPCGEVDPVTGAVIPAGVAALTSIIESYEAEQSRICATFLHCTTDGGRLATFVPDATLVSADGNHLGVAGLARLAELVWPSAHGALMPPP